MMELHLVGKNNLEITAAIEDYARKKIEPVNERFRHITQVNIVFHIENLDQCAKANIHFNGQEVHAEAKGSTIYEAIDRLIDKLFAQLTKIKERQQDSHR